MFSRKGGISSKWFPAVGPLIQKGVHCTQETEFRADLWKPITQTTFMNSNQQISEKCISIIVRYIQLTVTEKGVRCDFDFKKCVANSENLDPAPSTFKMWESCDTAISWRTVLPQSSPIIICCQLLIPLEFVWIQNPQICRFIIKNMSAGTPMFQYNNVPLPTRLYWSMLD